MAPKCVCGHKASDHNKQMNIRTWCGQFDGTAGGAFEESWECPCLMYRPREEQ